MDEPSFRIFYAEVAPALRAYLAHLTNDNVLTDDLLQETFIRFLNASTGSLLPVQKRAYLYTTASRLVADHWRRQRIHRRWVENTDNEESSGEEHGSIRFDMEKALQRISPRERSLLWLAYVEDYDHAEISKMLGLRKNSVKVLLYRARKKILGILTSIGINPSTQP